MGFCINVSLENNLFTIVNVFRRNLSLLKTLVWVLNTVIWNTFIVDDFT